MASSGLEIGARIDGRYVLLRRLGVGGFGEVWLATDERSASLAQQVAIKMLHPHLFRSSEVIRDRFEQEAEVLARLDHPSIVRPLAFETSEERAYLAMEYVDGVPLNRVLAQCARRQEHLDSDELVRVFDDLTGAVHYLHGEGIVHRDLKPSNVMFVRRGGRAFVKVLDLGIARILGASGRDATTLGRVMGSFHYASPEQIRGERVDERSDVFALGAILFELVTSCRAFVLEDGRHAAADRAPLRDADNALPRIVGRITRGSRPRPSDAREGVPLELDPIVARALAIEPAERYASAASLANAALPILRALETNRGTTVYEVASQIVHEEALEATNTAPIAAPNETNDTNEDPGAESIAMASVAREGFPPRRRGALGGAVLAIAALLIGVGGYLVGRHGDAPDRQVETKVIEPPSPGVRPRAVAEPVNVPEAIEEVEEVEEIAPPPPPDRRPRDPPAPPPEAPSELAQRLAWAREDPSDLTRVAALQDALRRALAALPRGPNRTRLERRIETSAMNGDVEGLAACVRALAATAP